MMNKKQFLYSFIPAVLAFAAFQSFTILSQSNNRGCILDSLTLNNTINQYFDFKSSYFYYKSNKGKGSFKIEVTCDEQVKTVEFPSILGVKSKHLELSQEPGEDKKVEFVYDWKGSYAKGFDLLSSFSNFSQSQDNQTLGLSLPKKGITVNIINENTGEIFSQDEIKKIVFIPDDTTPYINGKEYNNDNMKERLINEALFSYSIDEKNDEKNFQSIYEIDEFYNSRPFKLKFFPADEDIYIQTPTFSDYGSGLRGFDIYIEKHDNKNDYSYYSFSGSTNMTKIKKILPSYLEHDFSDVSQQKDFVSNFGTRTYSWGIKTQGGDGVEIKNKICDMVGNCIYIPNKDFNLISNVLDELKTEVVNQDGIIAVKLRDKYGNKVLPIEGARDIRITGKLKKSESEETTFSLFNSNGEELTQVITFSGASNFFGTFLHAYNLPNGEFSIKSIPSLESITIDIVNKLKYQGVEKKSIHFDL